MNKAELIDHIARVADLSKASAGRSLEAFISAVQSELKQGNPVSIVGFGTFDVSQREARTGHNPKTKEPVSIKAAKVPKFRAGKGLKDAIN